MICICDHEIKPDVLDGKFICEHDWNDVIERLKNDIAPVFQSEADRQEWLEKHTHTADRERGRTFEDELSLVVVDVVERRMSVMMRFVRECDNCGSLWLKPRPFEGEWICYSPSTEWQGRPVLQSICDETGHIL